MKLLTGVAPAGRSQSFGSIKRVDEVNLLIFQLSLWPLFCQFQSYGLSRGEKRPFSMRETTFCYLRYSLPLFLYYTDVAAYEWNEK